MRAWKLISAVALVMVVTGTTWAITVPPLPGGVDYLKSRNADNGSTYVVAGLDPGDSFSFNPTGLPGNGTPTAVLGNLNGSPATRTVQKFQAPGAIGNEDSWGIALLYQIAPGHISNPGSNGTIIGFNGPIVYDNSAGTQSTWCTTMFHSGVDISVNVLAGNGSNGIPTGQLKETISTSGLKFELYAVDAAAIDAALAGAVKDSVNLADYVPASRLAIDKYKGWTGNTIGGVLLADGTSDYFQSTVVVDATGAVVSNSLDASTVYFNINAAGAGLWDYTWGTQDKLLTPDGIATNAWFQWTLDSGQRGWNVHSDDVGGAVAAVPEPVTILGVILGIGGLGGYIRRRFQTV